jgi:quinol monooxygenase YgiN
MPQVCLHTTYTVHPGTETHLLGLIYNLQQSATREPKCQYFNAFTSAEAGSGVVRVVEIWDSQPDYLAYVRRTTCVRACRLTLNPGSRQHGGDHRLPEKCRGLLYAAARFRGVEPR